ncbi:PseG/SpsG family protein [Kitasatospora phosalacinea]|uniref:PseG/SpsG family protein n=1 Tax=Kitasatospora phosalacinea TaxID=2065 RepID=UPI00364F8DBC
MRADASPEIGGGHVMRCLALAGRLRERGVSVSFLARIDGLDWLRSQVVDGGYALLSPASTPGRLVALAEAHRLDALVLDSHTLAPGCSEALRSAGVVTAAVVDGDRRGQSADLFIDQDPAADDGTDTRGNGDGRADHDGFLLRGGLRHALVREEIVSLRERPTAPPTGGTPHVLCFFGATDPASAAPVAVGLLLATGLPVRATVVSARAELRRQVLELPTAAGQSVTVIGPTTELPALVRSADLVVAAAGSSVLELLCLGAAVALVSVADSQRPTYDALVERDLAVGLGGLLSLRSDSAAAARATASLRALVISPSKRSGLAARGRAAVDGGGCVRVAEALLGLVRGRRSSGRATGRAAGPPARVTGGWKG